MILYWLGLLSIGLYIAMIEVAPSFEFGLNWATYVLIGLRLDRDHISVDFELGLILPHVLALMLERILNLIQNYKRVWSHYIKQMVLDQTDLG